MFLSEEEINSLMQWIVDAILIPHFMDLGLNASGEWLANVGTRADGQTGIISGRKYTEQLVWGRMPGNRPPISALENWVKIKLGLSGQQATSAAFAIANKIAKEGTNIYKDRGTDLLEILEAPETIAKINAHLAQQLRVNVQLHLEREIKQAFA